MKFSLKILSNTIKKKSVYVAGHKGMVGSSIVRALTKKGDVKILVKDKSELNLLNQDEVNNFFESNKVDQVYLAAAKVGGIYANNKYPADFIFENTLIEFNIINSAFKNNVKELLFLGSSCIYPKHSPQPIKEDYLLKDTLEPTNEPYAIAKIAGIKYCESLNRQYGDSHGIDYRSIMPSNLYGIGDNYHPLNSHVIPALIRRFHEAMVSKSDSVSIWGTGIALREFLYVDDLAEACLFLMNINKNKYNKMHGASHNHINVGSEFEITINDLANLISEVVGYKGDIIFDRSKPDGTLRKVMDSSKIRSLGWKPKQDLHNGIHLAYQDFKKNIINSNKVE